MPCDVLEHNSFSSDCLVLDVGCYLRYWDGGEWLDADKGAGPCLAGIDGKFSDGTSCYTVVNGIVTSKTTYIYMNFCFDDTLGNGNVTITANSLNRPDYFNGSPIAVNTNVTIDFILFGSEMNQISSSIVISNGSSSNTSTFGSWNVGETVISAFVDNVSPSSSGTQVFLLGNTTPCN